MKFTASIIEPSTNRTTANVLFADPETNPEAPSVLLFSRAIEFENSAYYFEVNDQSNSSYGGLESVQVSRNRLAVTLKRELVEEFGNEDFSQIEVQFDVDDEMYQVVLEVLHKIFDGHNILEVK